MQHHPRDQGCDEAVGLGDAQAQAGQGRAWAEACQTPAQAEERCAQ